MQHCADAIRLRLPVLRPGAHAPALVPRPNAWYGCAATWSRRGPSPARGRAARSRGVASIIHASCLLIPRSGPSTSCSSTSRPSSPKHARRRAACCWRSGWRDDVVAELIARINGENEDSVSVLDRGLHYGDGVFETMAVRDGVVPLWGRHRDRLLRGCERLGIVGRDVAGLQREVADLARDCTRAVIKAIVTRGEGGRG